MADPVIVATVQHRECDRKKRKLGHVGYVQRRAPKRMSGFGGKRFAAWARRTVDGVVTGTPERFQTYATEDEALAHAEYAAAQVTPTAVELVATGGHLP